VIKEGGVSWRLIGLNVYLKKPHLPTQSFLVFFTKKTQKNFENSKNGKKLFKKYTKVMGRQKKDFLGRH
jgi:hypothetical protein